jgi:hypothetical protein
MLIKEKYFVANDMSGRSSPIVLSESHIQKFWDLKETDEDDGSLEDFLETCESGDKWINGTESLECVDY